MSREVSHYVVTAHPPGGVLHTVKCNFLAPDSEVRTRKSVRENTLLSLLPSHPPACLDS